MSRFKEKLLGRPKEPSSQAEISSFLNGPSDKLHMTGVPPPTAPKLQRIDTSTARRWPTAAEINSRARGASGPQPARRRRNTADLVVRFTDHNEIVGFGGDEEEAPTIRISSNKAMNMKKKKQETLAASGRLHSQSVPADTSAGVQPSIQIQVDEISGRIKEMGTPGYEDIVQSVSEKDFSSSGHLKVQPPDPSSAVVKIQAEMRAAEGMSLRNSVLLGIVSPTASETDEELTPSTPTNNVLQPQPKRMSPMVGMQTQNSRANGQFQSSPDESPSVHSNSSISPQQLQKAPTWTLREAALAARDDALSDFTDRM